MSSCLLSSKSLTSPATVRVVLTTGLNEPPGESGAGGDGGDNGSEGGSEGGVVSSPLDTSGVSGGNGGGSDGGINGVMSSPLDASGAPGGNGGGDESGGTYVKTPSVVLKTLYPAYGRRCVSDPTHVSL